MGTIRHSLEDWCVKHDRQDILELWNYDKNNKTPKEIGCSCDETYFIHCQRYIHEDIAIVPSNITRLKTGRCLCKKCNSIAQFLIDTYGEEALCMYWDYTLNTKSPWDIDADSQQIVYIKCQKIDYHGSYPVSTKHFSRDNVRCAYCFHRKVHPRDSFAQHYITKYGDDFLDKYWDYERNTVNPWEISPNGCRSVYIKCLKNHQHQSIFVSLSSFAKDIIYCKECKEENKQKEIDILKRLINAEPVSDEEKKFVMTFEDLTGMTFGKLHVLSCDYQKRLDDVIADRKRRIYWICQCECGGEKSIKSILGEHLKSGKIVSCGCYRREMVTGENHPNWKGGVNSENRKLRSTPECLKWRQDVLRRDNYQCQCCGSSSNLNVHHIYNFLDHIDLRLNIDNGLTLCEQCHSAKFKNTFHNMYGTYNNTPEQLRKYILNKSGVDIYVSHPEILNL